MKSDRKLSIAHLLVLGIAMTALPLSAVTLQALRVSKGARLLLPAIAVRTQNSTLVPLARFQTPLSTVSLDALTGNNRFNPGDMAYLFVSQSNDVLYPFSITRRLPANSEHADFTIMLRAKVIEQRGEALDLEFDFDRASPPQAFLAHVAQAPQDQLHLELAVSPDGRATIAAFHAGNQIYNQRVITKSVLPGRSIEIAASAPPT